MSHSLCRPFRRSCARTPWNRIVSVVLYGKHPGFGDFLSWGFDRDAVAMLEAWMQEVLPEVRDLLGDAWDTVWATAPDLRFWIGPEILGQPLCGIWRASTDKVGRTYPLMLGLTGPVSPPPVHPAHDPAPYVALAAHLARIEDQTAGQGGVQGLVAGFDLPPLSGTAYDAAQAGMLWGLRGDGDLDRLFRDATEADGYCAQYGRSHWWQTATPARAAGWLSINGLPDAKAMRWLLSERLHTAPQTDTDAPQHEGDTTGRGQE